MKYLFGFKTFKFTVYLKAFQYYYLFIEKFEMFVDN